MQEIWKDILGYEGKYQVSNLGNIKNLKYLNSNKTKLMCLKKHNKGYKQVELSKNHKTKTYLVHRLVAQAFIPNPNNYPLINHKDFNKQNNNVENLEWCNQSQNMKHSCSKIRETCFTRKVTSHTPKKLFSKIFQYDKDNNLIKDWENICEIKNTLNYHPTSIKECCEGKRKQAYGYKWQYAI